MINSPPIFRKLRKPYGIFSVDTLNFLFINFMLVGQAELQTDNPRRIMDGKGRFGILFHNMLARSLSTAKFERHNVLLSDVA